MQLIDELEEKLIALLQRLEGLKAENKELRDGQSATISSLEKENEILRQKLALEQNKNKEALERIEGIIQLIKEKTE